MATDLEIAAVGQKWKDIAYLPLTEEERDGMRMCMAMEVGEILAKGGAHTKDVFLESFLKLLGPGAEGFAKTAYVLSMAGNVPLSETELWDDTEEADLKALEAAYSPARDELVREGTAALRTVPTAESTSWLKTIFNSKMIWGLILGLLILGSIDDLVKTSGHKGSVTIEPETGAPSWVNNEADFKRGKYAVGGLMLLLCVYLWHVVAKDSKES
jgi:hypothetical protein